MIPVISALLLALSVYIIIFQAQANSPRERIKRRIDSLAENVELEYIHEAVITERKKERRHGRGRKLISDSFEDHLSASGVKLSAQEYIFLWAAVSLVPGLFGGLLNMKFFVILGLSITGFVIPPVMVKRARNSRQILFNKQLGESLTVMSNCMRSGYSFQQAMASVAKEMQPPISEEFSRVVKEINYGATMEEALQRMSERVRNKDLELLVSAVVTSLQVGANLSGILDTISETISDRLKLREEVRVASAQGRMSGIIIGILPAAMMVFLMIVNPDYMMGFVNNSIGRIMLVISVIMEGLGFFAISRVVDIKY